MAISRTASFFDSAVVVSLEDSGGNITGFIITNSSDFPFWGKTTRIDNGLVEEYTCPAHDSRTYPLNGLTISSKGETNFNVAMRWPA